MFTSIFYDLEEATFGYLLADGDALVRDDDGRRVLSFDRVDGARLFAATRGAESVEPGGSYDLRPLLAFAAGGAAPSEARALLALEDGWALLADVAEAAGRFDVLGGDAATFYALLDGDRGSATDVEAARACVTTALAIFREAIRHIDRPRP